MIYIFNPHKTLQIADNVKAILSGGYLPKQKKYCGFLKMIQEGKAHIICDYRGSSFISSYQNKNIINYLASNLELIIWCLYHKVSITRISHKGLDELSTKDKLVVFSHEHCQRILSDNDNLIRSKAHILVHLTHYFFRTNEIYENLRRMPKATAICDTDLSESNYFQRYMPNIKFRFVRTYLPKRFIDTKFIERDKVPAKSVAVGSCQTYKLADYTNNFMSFYNTNTLHPMRLFICKNKDKFIDFLDIRISIINDHLRKVDKILV